MRKRVNIAHMKMNYMKPHQSIMFVWFLILEGVEGRKRGVERERQISCERDINCLPPTRVPNRPENQPVIQVHGLDWNKT